jgi:Asp-tRNA(Asn)/Glu-tRNA(Gln) amidotransferase A subunit family amidase
VVELLRTAGAVIMGKTLTAELVIYTPGMTRNPHNPDHTPDGSSSGSAAADEVSLRSKTIILGASKQNPV